VLCLDADFNRDITRADGRKFSLIWLVNVFQIGIFKVELSSDTYGDQELK